MGKREYLRFTVTNNGPNPAEDATFSVNTGALMQATVVSLRSSQGTCSTSNARCLLGDVLFPTATPITIDVVVRIAMPNFVMQGYADTSNLDPNSGNNFPTITVTVAKPPAARCTPPGEVGVPYSSSCTITDGFEPYTCSLASGTLPAGLTLGSSSCGIAGIPTAPGTGSFSVRVMDDANFSVTSSSSLQIFPALNVSTVSLLPAAVNKSYTATLAAIGGPASRNWSVIDGSLPIGLALNGTTGVIAGIPTALGVNDFTVRVADPLGGQAQKPLRLVVNNGPLTGRCTLGPAEVGVGYSGACTGVLGLPPYTCTLATGTLPTGLTLGGDCTVTGTPTTAGTKSFGVRVADSGGLAVNVAASLNVLPHVAITTATLPKVPVNRSFVTTLVAAGGLKPFTWAVTGGAVPSGVTLNAALGTIAGVPTATGVSDFTVRVTDAKSGTAERPLQLVVNQGPLVGRCPLGAAEVNVPYSGACTGTAGLPPYTCSLATTATPPTGLTLNSDCTLTGTPTIAGAKSFGVRVSDSGGLAVNVAASLSVLPHVAIATSSLLPATANKSYTGLLVGAYGLKPYAWSVIDGGVPIGVTLNATTGYLTGIPTTPSAVTFTAQVRDALGGTAVRLLRLVVNTGPFAATCLARPGEANVSYTGGCTVSGGLPPYTCALAGGTTLPAGLTLQSNCTITGTPTTAGAKTFSVTVTDAALATKTVAGSLTILPAVQLTTTSLPAGRVGVAYSGRLLAAGGKTPYTWSVSPDSGAPLPAGLTLNPATGYLTGTPAGPGSSSVTFRVTDALGGTSNRILTITIIN